MESSSPSHCKLSSPTDTASMACPAASLEPNFQVDDLLDFPNDDADYDESVLSSPHATAAAGSLLFAPPLPAPSIPMSKDEAALHEELSHGLCVPPDELVHQLEWLSSFNEDNFFAGGDAKLLSSTTTSSRASAGLARCKDAPVTAHRARDDFRSESPVSVLEHTGHAYALNHHVQRANRIRKARTGGRVWSLDILKPILFENRLKASYESSSLLVTSYPSAYSEPLCSFLQADESERPYKRLKQAAHVDAAIDSALVRKCTHCSVQKTPQWRAGPMGPKTLCNACGVRYKSGRLVPEYRPAASPSFVNEVHSNSHRRILEMRRVKEVDSSIKHYKSKAERPYRRDSTKREPYIVPRTLDEHACKETQSSKESSLSVEVSACGEAEGSRGGGIPDEGASGKEDSSDGSTISCEATIACNEMHLQKASNAGMLAYKDKHMQENACGSRMIAAFEGKSPCGGKDASLGGMFGLDKGQGHKGEARVEENAVYVAK